MEVDMQRMYRILMTRIGLIVGVVALGVIPLLAQGQPQNSLMAQGQLLQVDVDNNTFTIKTEEGQERVFDFTDQTEINGARTSVEGLATLEGNSVIVEYHTEDSAAIATRIEVQPKQ